MEACNHPLRDVSEYHVTRLPLWFQRNGLDKRLGRISLRLNPLHNKGQGPKTEIFNKSKSLPVLKKTLTVDVEHGRYCLTVLLQFQTSTDTASVKIKTCVSLPISVYFISRRDGKALSDREELQMSLVENSMTHIVMKGDTCVANLKSVLRYAVTFASEYKVSLSEAKVTDVVKDMISSDFLPAKFKQSYQRYV